MPKKISQDQCKDTGLALVLICLMIALFKRSFSPLGPAVGVLVLTMTVPMLLKPLARLWFAFSHGLGQIMSTVLLSIVFFVVVTPLAWFRRLLGRDAMRLKGWRQGRESAFVLREHVITPEDLEKPF